MPSPLGSVPSPSFGWLNWDPTTPRSVSTDLGGGFQKILNQVTSNPAVFTPGYDPMKGMSGHAEPFGQLLNVINTKTLTGADDTGAVSIGPGGINLQSKNGWSGHINPQGAGINFGPVGVQGTWAGDKSIQANINLRSNKMPARFMSEFVTPEPNPQASYPLLESDSNYLSKTGVAGNEFIPIQQRGFGLEGINPLAPEGQRFGVLLEQPQSEARKLMEQQTDEYAARNPYYRYQ